MAHQFEPNLSLLPAGQRLLWDELRDVPHSFVLCGGTAIAIQLGHRMSLDFDFLASEQFDPDVLYDALPFLTGSQPIQKSANTLTCVVDRGEPVRISFFGTPSVQLIKSPLVAADNQLSVASLVDLAGMNAAVVQKRAEAKDYIDLDAILSTAGVDLSHALAAAVSLYGSSFNPVLTLKSLTFFGDGDLPKLPRAVQDRLTAAVQAVDPNQLPKIT